MWLVSIIHKLCLSLVIVLLPAVASAAKVSEFTFSPSLGYSSSSGILVGSDFTFLLPILDQLHLQLGAEGSTESKSGHSYLGGKAGLSYSFGDDFVRSYFMSLGWGHGTHHPRWSEKDGVGYGFVQLGKRFLISDEYRLMYKPQIEMQSTSNTLTVLFNLVSFSLEF